MRNLWCILLALSVNLGCASTPTTSPKLERTPSSDNVFPLMIRYSEPGQWLHLHPMSVTVDGPMVQISPAPGYFGKEVKAPFPDGSVRQKIHIIASQRAIVDFFSTGNATYRFSSENSTVGVTSIFPVTRKVQATFDYYQDRPCTAKDDSRAKEMAERNMQWTAWLKAKVGFDKFPEIAADPRDCFQRVSKSLDVTGLAVTIFGDSWGSSILKAKGVYFNLTAKVCGDDSDERDCRTVYKEVRRPNSDCEVAVDSRLQQAQDFLRKIEAGAQIEAAIEYLE
jgi:hypothetical protein